MENTNTPLRRAQLAQMQIMDKIHDLCLRYNIKYYLIAGSALGVRRHGGFIPWDVDIDIAMPREDYEIFLSHSKELSPIILCDTFYNNKNHLSPHALAIWSNSKLVLKNDNINNIKDRKIYIDIFPLDYVPDSMLLRKLQKHSILLIKKIKKLKNGKCFPSNSALTKIIKKTISIMFRPITFGKINHLLDKIMSMCKKNKSGLTCSMASHYKYEKQTFNSSIYGKPTMEKFEDRRYCVPEHIEEYLTQLYGDYHKLPSKETQEAQKAMIEEVNIW